MKPLHCQLHKPTATHYRQHDHGQQGQRRRVRLRGLLQGTRYRGPLGRGRERGHRRGLLVSSASPPRRETLSAEGYSAGPWTRSDSRVGGVAVSSEESVVRAAEYARGRGVRSAAHGDRGGGGVRSGDAGVTG